MSLDSNCAPTAVNLSSFKVIHVENASGSQLIVSWSTSAEIDTSGFHVVSSSDGTLISARQVTEALVLSKGSEGGDYSVILPYNETVEPPLSLLSFWLYEEETDGGFNYYGPAVVDVNASQMDQFMFLPFLSQ